MKFRLAAAVGLLGLLGFVSVAVLFVYQFVWQPRQMLRGFDAFVAQHHEGTGVRALVDDDFVALASDLTFDSDSLKDVAPGAPARQRERLRTSLRDESSRGVFEITWTYQPPFGRVFLHVEYEAGNVTALKTSELD